MDGGGARDASGGAEHPRPSVLFLTPCRQGIASAMKLRQSVLLLLEEEETDTEDEKHGERSGAGKKKMTRERTAWGDAEVAILGLPVSCRRRSSSYR